MPDTNLRHPEEACAARRREGRTASVQPGREPLAVYIHWPFCRSKCPYCDFNSHVRERVDARSWTNALIADLDRQARWAPEHKVVSIFFGGGTPSLMPPETAAALIERVKRHWKTERNLEVTIEANPNSAEAERFAGFAEAGVNRLSLGVQSLNPKALKFLGRAHGRAEAIAAIELSQKLFRRTSFDLIYARPRQTSAAWRGELDEALSLAGEHLSLYQLTIEPGTAFHTRARLGEFAIPDEEDAAALFEMTQERLAAHGLPAYEISNHARPGAESRHNLAYWRYEDYLGIGPGAHGRITRNGVKYATRQRRLPEAWLKAADFEETTAIRRESAVEEMVMMGLRLAEGIQRARLETLAECSVEALFGISLTRLIDGGFVTLGRRRFAATPAGRQRLNSVLGALFG